MGSQRSIYGVNLSLAETVKSLYCTHVSYVCVLQYIDMVPYVGYTCWYVLASLATYVYCAVCDVGMRCVDLLLACMLLA